MPDDHPFTDAGRGPRLQKVLAEAGVASRRACEDLIEAGGVMVNGKVVRSLPVWVDPDHDRITVEGRPLKTRRPKNGSGLVYVMLHKPRGVVCTNSDPEGRPRAIDLVRHKSRARLYPVGRLDMESSGLLLLTNDGDLANRLTHPRHEIPKIYEVTVNGAVTDEAIRKLESGLYLGDRRTGRGVKTDQTRLRLLKRDRERTRLRIELWEGRNRQIRRMLARLGYRVRKLRRVRMGPLNLGGLKARQWRELLPAEVKKLKRSVRLR